MDINRIKDATLQDYKEQNPIQYLTIANIIIYNYILQGVNESNTNCYHENGYDEVHLY